MSSTLTSAELAQMRTDLEDVMLPDTCTILSGTQTVDGQGGGTLTWGTTTTGVKCRVDFLSGDEAVFGGQLKPFVGFNLTVPHNTTLTTANRVIHGTITYNVSEIDTGKSWALYLRARLEKA